MELKKVIGVVELQKERIESLQANISLFEQTAYKLEDRFFMELLNYMLRLMKLEETVSILEAKTALQEGILSKLNLTPKTCEEIRASDPSKQSGMYWVDPDGQGSGDPPIYVYCNMITGSTSISHDKENASDVGHCRDPGCYSLPIKYNATMKQIMALVQQSEDCQQLIQVSIEL